MTALFFLLPNDQCQVQEHVMSFCSTIPNSRRYRAPIGLRRKEGED